jgi:hypothetical protein
MGMGIGNAFGLKKVKKTPKVDFKHVIEQIHEQNDRKRYRT